MQTKDLMSGRIYTIYIKNLCVFNFDRIRCVAINPPCPYDCTIDANDDIMLYIRAYIAIAYIKVRLQIHNYLFVEIPNTHEIQQLPLNIIPLAKLNKT